MPVMAMKTEALAARFNLRPEQVSAIVTLVDGGATIPFIARYRKEATGGVDDQTLREFSEGLSALRALDKRREEIQKSLETQGVFTPELAAALESAGTLSQLEDMYRPYRPKRRTRATIARERGLEGLAAALMLQKPGDDPETLARAYITDDVPSADDALAGARDILAEDISDDAAARGKLRALCFRTGVVQTKKAAEDAGVYQMYAEYEEPASRMAAHRVLAINRGEREEALRVNIRVDDAGAQAILRAAFARNETPCAKQVALAAEDAWQRLISPSLERELRASMTERAERAAIRVFADNLRQLLMQPPVKGRVTLGVDPGFRTGCKLAVVDASGRVLDVGVGYFTIPGQTREHARAKELILSLIQKHGVTAIAIGNGTASREAEAFVAALLPEGVSYMLVSEAGASVYSASKLAAEEFPEYDVSLRSAVSIARRMQDPLAELVKIEPKAIGVGQYQHDLSQTALNDALSGVVEGCVNLVGVELSTASAALLSHVAGVGPSLAKNIAAYRDENGFSSRAELKKVKGLGAKAFEQCAGFLRLHGGKEPLDATAVHPESYKPAKALLKILGCKTIGARGIPDALERARAYGLEKLTQELDIGMPTLLDILQELQKPGRDPRDDLPPPLLRTDVLDIADLAPGMQLTGTVRNVVDFGAFIDIGVHQDGLCHLSRMAKRYIKHPSEVVKVGDIVTVWVLDVDAKKKRISLTMLPPNES